MKAESVGSIPRNRKQVYNIKSSLKEMSEIRDHLFSVMEQCKKEESCIDSFIRMVQGAPDAMCILVKDRQLNDMSRFCTNPQQFPIIGIDPTFNLGEFSVTVMTYRHLQLVDRNTKKSPVLIGPMVIHQRKTTQSYHFLASSIIGICPKLTSLVAFGTDGEKALWDAFHMQFKDAKHILCFLHVRDRIIRKLRDIGITGGNEKPFLHDIFGW